MRRILPALLALLVAAPALALDSRVPPIRLGPGSTGPIDQMTVGGIPIATLISNLGGSTGDIGAALALKAPIASPTFTGTASIPTLAITGTGSTGEIGGMTAGGVALTSALAGKASLGGAAFTGNISAPQVTAPVLGATGSGVGGATLNTGDSTHSGLVSFFRANGNRAGFIGYESNGTIPISADAGFKFDFQNSAPTILGNAIWHSGNFDPTAKANLSGATFTGNVNAPQVTAPTVGATATGVGTATMTVGDATHSGTLSMFRANGSRVGIIGYENSGLISMFADPGFSYNFNSAPLVNSATVHYNGMTGATFSGTTTLATLNISGSGSTGAVDAMTVGGTALSTILPGKANLSGATFTGNVAGTQFTASTIGATSSGVGGATLTTSDSTHTGLLSFFRSGGARAGFIGNESGGTIPIYADNGFKYDFQNVAPTILGNVVYHAGNFDPSTKATIGSAANFSSVQFTGKNVQIYTDSGQQNFVIRTGASGSDKYNAFNADGSFTSQATITAPTVNATAMNGTTINAYTASTNGSSSLYAGDATHAGYVAFFRPGSSRVGYIGYENGGLINIAADSGYSYNFNTVPYVANQPVLYQGYSAPSFNGNMTVTGGNVQLSAANGLTIGGNAVVQARQTGWTAATGTAQKGTFNADYTQTISASYSQTQMQALQDDLVNTKRRMLALEQLLRYHGLMN